MSVLAGISELFLSSATVERIESSRERLLIYHFRALVSEQDFQMNEAEYRAETLRFSITMDEFIATFFIPNATADQVKAILAAAAARRLQLT